jgi:hypothetical protein
MSTATGNASAGSAGGPGPAARRPALSPPDADAIVHRAETVRRRRRALAVSAMAALAVVGVVMAGGLLQRATAPQPAADWPIYGSLAELADAADVVVEGTVLDERREDVDIDLGPRDDRMPMIVYRLEVERAYLGATAPGDVVEVGVMDVAGAPTQEPRLTVEDTYVLFLGQSFDGRPRPLLNPFEAVYRVADDGALPPLTADERFARTITRVELEALEPSPAP